MKSKIDKKHIESKLIELKSYVETLKQMQSVSLDDLKNDPIKLGGIKYYLQISIECCLDMGAHFISRLRLRRYEGYKDIFTILGEANVIPAKLVPTLREMAGFRNMLVHLYWEIDAEKVFEILNSHLSDFEKYASHIAKFLKNQQENSS